MQWSFDLDVVLHGRVAVLSARKFSPWERIDRFMHVVGPRN